MACRRNGRPPRDSGARAARGCAAFYPPSSTRVGAAFAGTGTHEPCNAFCSLDAVGPSAHRYRSCMCQTLPASRECHS
eukprot:7182734-Prymnesium_polylepis.1